MKVEQDTLILDRIYMVKLSVLTGTSRIGNRHIMEAKTSHRSAEDHLLEVDYCADSSRSPTHPQLLSWLPHILDYSIIGSMSLHFTSHHFYLNIFFVAEAVKQARLGGYLDTVGSSWYDLTDISSIRIDRPLIQQANVNCFL